MKVYDTLIIGSGYSSVGYAVENGSTLICEEHQICDTHFYLPLRTFAYKPYAPTTATGTKMLEIFDSLGLFEGNMQNTNAFECALSKYVFESEVSILLKCRVVRVNTGADGVMDVTLHTNEGLTHVYTKKIIDTTNEAADRFVTVLFVTDNIDEAACAISEAFEGGKIEPAFFEGRYALHLPTHGVDENSIKLDIYERWKTLDTDAKILYIAPIFYSEAGKRGLCDDNYSNPVEAFEAGMLYAREGKI